MDALSSCLDDQGHNSFIGIYKHNLKINHLMFADDLLVFGLATNDNACYLKSILNCFADASGLKINPNKSSLIFPKGFTSDNGISSTLGISRIEDYIYYLGLPISTSRLHFAHFQPLLSKISSLLEGWKVKFLSFAGHLQFLKFTIANTIAYWIRGAIIPKACRKAISRICSKFLFFGNINDKKLHLISWKSVVVPKCKGGLGLPSFDLLYHNMACSFIFRMFNHNNLIGAWFRRKYDSPWKSPPMFASKFWKLFCQVAFSMLPSVSLLVHNNCNLSFLWDPWCNAKPIAERFYSNRLNHKPLHVFIRDGQWDLPDYVSREIASDILNTVILGEQPVLSWEGSPKPVAWKLTAKFYDDLDYVDWHKYIWHKGCALQFACFSWMSMLGKLKTADNLAIRGIPVFSGPNLMQVYDALDNCRDFGMMEKQFSFINVAAIIYFLWRERNNRRFANVWRSPNELKAVIIQAIRAKVKRWNCHDVLVFLLEAATSCKWFLAAGGLYLLLEIYFWVSIHVLQDLDFWDDDEPWSTSFQLPWMALGNQALYLSLGRCDGLSSSPQATGVSFAGFWLLAELTPLL
ncbi:uncharacterized protein LOC110107335 [Dendrobium catenatum]|uniref:uncharacterized protein LOC110107335 n=1 Tax=Dendrobium catenatum TaxID=906689 RepID=UPI0009F5BE8C|nr:uncharacterized protein LOC110107335 [Dendrobium catenatum]